MPAEIYIYIKKENVKIMYTLTDYCKVVFFLQKFSVAIQMCKPIALPTSNC